MFHYSFDKCMSKTFLYIELSPLIIPYNFLSFAFHSLCKFNEPFGCIRSPVQQNVFNTFEQVLVNFLINFDHSRIHDPHIHARPYRMIEECGMHRLTNFIVPSERERDIAHAAADLRTREIFLYPLNCIDVVNCIVVVLFDTCCNSEDIRIKNDVMRVKADFIYEYVICSFTDLYLSFKSIRLAIFVKCHDYHGRTVHPYFPGIFPELLLTFFQGN